MAEAQAQFQQALALHQAGNLSGAAEIYEAVLRREPRHFDAQRLLGQVAAHEGQWTRALDLFQAALRQRGDNAELHYNCGVALERLEQPAQALCAYERAIATDASLASAWFNRAGLLTRLNRIDDAIASYDAAIAAQPGYAQAYCNRGILLESRELWEAALASYDAAIAAGGVAFESYYNRGRVLYELGQPEAALASYDRALALNPASAAAHYNRGNVLRELRLFDVATASYDRAIALAPQLAPAHANRGHALRDAGDYAAAIASYERALALQPELEFLAGQHWQALMQICDWRDHGTLSQELLARLERGEPASPPFPVLTLTDSPALQRRTAAIWARTHHRVASIPGAQPVPHAAARLRIGYFSADFRDHPVARLMLGVLESRNRERFECTAFALAPPPADAFGARLRAAFDRFIIIQGKTDRDIAMLARQLEIDIAVDLGGYTRDARPGIFAYRAAPLQLAWLGFPGTTAAPEMDYLIADHEVIPDEAVQHYSEKLIFLPGSCLPCDTACSPASTSMTRRDAGLPDSGFVFCSFNHAAKITPVMFDCWMRILARVPGSVLWLSVGQPLAVTNLQAAAAQRCVDPGRLIFTQRLPSLAQHLARHRLADLFLDTLPYNAHSTAVDALWAGLPLLTCRGASFASRVAAGLLRSLQLPELITDSLAAYEDTAVSLAGTPERLAALAARLELSRAGGAFDTARYARRIESAYETIHQRLCDGLLPDHLEV